MTTAALIVAAGRGQRAGGGVPKQWRPLAGRRVIDWTLQAFRDAPEIGVIALVLSADDHDARAEFADCPGLVVATGGADRAGSVRNGLAALAGHGVTRVLIHDAARPCVSAETIAAVCCALNDHAAAAPGLAVTDALWTGTQDQVTGTRDRDGLYAAGAGDPGDASLLFDSSLEEKWDRAVALLGFDPNLLSSDSGRA